MNVTSLDSNNLETEVLQASGPVVVEFWTAGCKPCAKLGRVLRDFIGQIKIVSCNIDDLPEIGERFGVRSIPTLLFFKDGQIVDDAIGTVSDISEDEVRAKVEKLLSA